MSHYYSNTIIEREQIGVRMEKRMVKVLKALAEYHDISLGDLLEGITLHAFESKIPFNEETVKRIVQLKEVYGMDYGVNASHRFKEHTIKNVEDEILRFAKDDTRAKEYR